VRQRVSTTEVVLSWERQNAYVVHDDAGRIVFEVREVGRGFLELLGRMFLGPGRSCRMQVVDPATELVVLELSKPFRLVFPRMRVETAEGVLLGQIEGRFAWFTRRYVIREAQTGEEVEVIGPLWKPWTFTLKQGGLELGVIQKRWRGLGTEFLSDADDFGVELGQIASAEMRALTFAATFLVDMAHFERSKG